MMGTGNATKWMEKELYTISQANWRIRETGKMTNSKGWADCTTNTQCNLTHNSTTRISTKSMNTGNSTKVKCY